MNYNSLISEMPPVTVVVNSPAKHNNKNINQTCKKNKQTKKQKTNINNNLK